METFSNESFQNLIEARPDDVLQLFQRFGIKAKPTVETIRMAYVAFGDRFLVPLYDLITGSTSNDTGDDNDDSVDHSFDALNIANTGSAATDPATENTKSTDYTKSKSLFDKIISGVSTVGDTVDKVDTLLGKNPAAPSKPGTSSAKKAAAASATSNTVIYIAIGVVLLLVAVIVVFKFRK